MSRPRRLARSGFLLHAIARANEGRASFESDDDFRAFLAVLRKYKERYRLKLYSYVLLPSHFHLLLSSDLDGGVPRAMREILTNFTKWYNRHRRRRGALWQPRYKSVVVEEGAPALACMSYLDRHPVEAGVASRLDRYHWSSHRYYVRHEADPVVDPYPGYIELSPEGGDRARRYALLVHGVKPAGRCGEESVTSALAFGSDEFVRKVSNLLRAG